MPTSELLSGKSPIMSTITTTVEVCYRARKAAAEPVVVGDPKKEAEVEEIKKTCAHHESLCRQFAECSQQLRQNNAQLEILNETATFLKARHALIRKQIAAQPTDQSELRSLEVELGKVNQQVQMWMRELEEVNDCRTDLEIRFVKLRAALQKSVTSVQLAAIDLDLLQNKHADRWKKFLEDVRAEEAISAAAALVKEDED